MSRSSLRLFASAAAFLLALVAVSSTSIADSAATDDVSFVSKSDNSTQHYLLLRPKSFTDAQPHDVMIVLHGHGSDRSQIVNDSVNEFRAARDVAASHNMLLISPDYRGQTSWMGPLAEADLVQIISELKGRFHIGKVIISGASMGGSAALTFAVLHPELINGVVSMNGTANHFEYDNFQDAIKQSFGGTKAAIPLEYKKRSAEYWPERLTTPVGITASGKDETVPSDSVVRLAGVVKKLNPDTMLIYRKEEGHSTSYADSKAIFEFVVGKAIRKSPSP